MWPMPAPLHPQWTPHRPRTFSILDTRLQTSPPLTLTSELKSPGACNASLFLRPHFTF